MFSRLGKMVSGCFNPVRKYGPLNRDEENAGGSGGGRDGNAEFLWGRDLDRHSLGEFSFAVVQANKIIEDHSQVEVGRNGIYVGVYDGHGGPEASRYVREHLFAHLIRLAQENRTISEDVISRAFSATEQGFLTIVRRSRDIQPAMATVGSCCLVGVIWKGMLYVANLGDSRAIMGCLANEIIVTEQLTSDHNASREEVRQELQALHPDDPDIVMLKSDVWRVKGIIQISRSIGDAYLKWTDFIVDSPIPRLRLKEPIARPVLLAEPSIYTRAIQPQDTFVIFASDGLWEHLTNQQAAEIVFRNPRAGIARRLIKTALTEAARKRNMSYDDVKKVRRDIRRHYHDDITVVVVFLDQESDIDVPEMSIRGFIDTVGPSGFSIPEGMDATQS